MKIGARTHKAKCKWCGRDFESLHKRQLEFNHAVHEATCKESPVNKKRLKEEAKNGTSKV